MKEGLTSIQVMRETVKRLKLSMRYGQTYDQKLNELLDQNDFILHEKKEKYESSKDGK